MIDPFDYTPSNPDNEVVGEDTTTLNYLCVQYPWLKVLLEEKNEELEKEKGWHKHLDSQLKNALVYVYYNEKFKGKLMRKPGSVVRTRVGAGFCSESLVVRLKDPNLAFPPYENGCPICGKYCWEWDTCEVIVDGKPTGECVYHVSECQMEDL